MLHVLEEILLWLRKAHGAGGSVGGIRACSKAWHPPAPVLLRLTGSHRTQTKSMASGGRSLTRAARVSSFTRDVTDCTESHVWKGE